MHKYFIAISLLISLIFVACNPQDNTTNSGYNLLPQHTVFVWYTPGWNEWKADISNNTFFESNANNLLSIEGFNTLSDFHVFQDILPGLKNVFFVKSKSASKALLFPIANNQHLNTPNTFNKNRNQIILHQGYYWQQQKGYWILTTTNQDAVHYRDAPKYYFNQTLVRLFKEGQTQQYSVNDSLLINNSLAKPKNQPTAYGHLMLQHEILPHHLLAQGVWFPRDSSVLKEVWPQLSKSDNVHTLSKVLPKTIKSAITYQLLPDTLSKKENVIKPNNVLCFATLKADSILIWDSILRLDFFETYKVSTDQYLATPIWEVNLMAANFTNQAFNLTDTSLKYVTKLAHYFILSSQKNTLESLLDAYNNKETLFYDATFQEGLNKISSKSSILIINSGVEASKSIGRTFMSNPKTQENYPISLTQLVKDDGFFHFNFSAPEKQNAYTKQTKKVQKVLEITLEEPLLNNPQFLSDPRRGGKSIVAQDIANTLHLYSNKGKKLWSRSLKNPILGNLNEVDLFKNGKKQLAFCTENAFYVIDRLGRDVSPFPLKFKDAITQPLAVFDYDNTRNYRFIITQGNEVLMLNNKGKRVRGFKFKNAKSKINTSPKHIRIGQKDYILITQDNGRLLILNRQGKQRLNVTHTMAFSDIPITREGNNFVIITEDFKKVTIDQKALISTKNLEVTQSYWFTTLGSLKATLDDHILRINNRHKIELPYGIYTPLKLESLAKNQFITLTEIQEKKVHLYTRDGNAVTGFPVFGSSLSTLGLADSKNLHLLTKGKENSIILYRITN